MASRAVIVKDAEAARGCGVVAGTRDGLNLSDSRWFRQLGRRAELEGEYAAAIDGEAAFAARFACDGVL